MTVGTLYAQLQLVTTAFDSALSAAGGKLKTFGQSLVNTGRDIMLLTAPLAAVGGGAIKAGMNFDSAFAKIEGLVGVTGNDLAMLKTRVMDLAGQTAKSPTELAEALYYLTSSGLSAAEAGDVLEVSAKAAAAGLGTTQDVAKAVAFALNAYRDVNLTAAQATDVLTAAVKYGTIEADELAPVLGRLLPIASDLDISYNQVAGTLAVMSRTGLDAAEASTSLSSIFSNLLKPSKAARDVLSSVGLSMAELREVAAREPDGVIQVYRLLNETLNDEQFSVVVPNVRALRGAMNFLSQDAGLVDEVMRGVADSAGATDHAFGIVAETAQFQLDQAMSDVQASLLTLWESLRGPVINALNTFRDGLKNVTEWFKNLSPEAKTLITQVGGLVLAIGPLLVAFGLFNKVLGGFIGLAGSAIKLLVGFGGGLLTAGQSLLTMVRSGTLLQTVMGTLFSPAGLFVMAAAGVATLVLTLIDWAQASARGKAAADDMIKSLSEAKGGFKDLEDATSSMMYAAEKLNEKYDPWKQSLLDTALFMVPVIGQMRQSNLESEKAAAFAELQAAAERQLAEDIAKKNAELANTQAEEYLEKLEEIKATLRDLGPNFILTADNAKLMGDRFGVSAEVMGELAGEIASEWDASSATILEALGQLPPDMELTEEKAAEMAGMLGVSIDEIKAKFLELHPAALDMSNALGDISTRAEGAFSNFQNTATTSMDEVTARMDTLRDRLIQMDQVDLAAIGPSAEHNWGEARARTQDELDALTAYVDGDFGKMDLIMSGKSKQTADEVVDNFTVMASDISGALKGLEPDSDKAWKDFNKSMKKGKDDSVAQADKLKERLRILGEVDLAKLGPDALAAWIDMRDKTQTQLDGIENFIDNKGDIIEDLIPEALGNSRDAAAEQWDKMFTDASTTGEDIADETEDNADATADAFPDALTDKQPILDRQLALIKSKHGTTAADVTATAEDEGSAAADALPDEFQKAMTPLGNALNAVFQALKTIFDSLARSAGPWGAAIGSNWISALVQAIRNGRQAVADAAAFATDPIHGHSPPKSGPLKFIEEWAKNVAKSWIDPFKETLRAAKIGDSIGLPSTSVVMPAPGLAAPMRDRYDDTSRGRGGDRPMIGQQIINGMQPGDVERETTTAIRRISLEWDMNV